MKHVLVPTDFSDTAKNAVEYAAAFCKEYNLKLSILHVMHIPVTDTNAGVELMDALLDNTRKAAGEKLDGLKKEVQSNWNIEVETISDFGLAADVILEKSKSLDAEFVVMGTSGESGFIRSLLGSVSLSVSRKCHSPVIVIPEKAEYDELEVIVFGNNHKGKLADTLDDLGNLRKDGKSQVHLVSVEPGEDEYSQEVIFDEGGMKEVSVWDETVKEGLQHYMKEENADLLVLKHYSQGFIQDLFRTSTTRELLMDCTVPVLILN